MDKFFTQQYCDRCGVSLIGQSRIMSIFNRDCICETCKEEEKKHPDYEKAVEAEREAVAKGIMDFPGIGYREIKEDKEFISNEVGVCPCCNAENLEYGSMQLSDDELAYYPWTCRNCGKSGKEYFRLDFIGHNVHTKNGEVMVNLEAK